MNQIRIIGGKWCSRKINFPNVSSLRPTPNRVRETLFNWLMNNIVGSNCLDCFAGSGALGFEALSRGAASVTMIDKSWSTVENLKHNSLLLEAKNLNIYCAEFPIPEHDFSTILGKSKFNIVFLDPPYNQNLIKSSCAWLEKMDCLAKGALIYIEAERSLTPLPIPKNWQVLKSKIAGQVGYHLLTINE